MQLSPFQVTSEADQGYRAGNSVSATLIDTPIKDLPFTISAFTQQFISDINQNDLLGTIRYAPGVSGASSDFTGGNAQYVVDGFPQYPAAQRHSRAPTTSPTRRTSSASRSSRGPPRSSTGPFRREAR